ncbi:DNA-binding response regulator [Lachnospiraceae bacterium]|jgi:DNA-binding LytR/AlgR family response regulator|nr:DNA-binding response regulator [Lachnospiraceae bacterium]
MRIAVCDDEKEVRDMFAGRLHELYPDAAISLYQSGDELLLAEGQPDIVLLDIQMPGKNGMETARDFRRNNKEAVIIFVTALEDYVFQAFDVGAFHYLVKPFDEGKFVQVLANAAAESADRKRGKEADKKKKQQPLLISAGGRHILANWEEIIYAEVYDRKVVIHTVDSDIEYYGRMKELEEKAGDNFYRPHRAYLVNFDFVRKYDASVIYLERGQALMAKQNYRDFVKSYLKHIRKKERA